MPLGRTNNPELINGLTDPISWINNILSLLADSVLNTQAEIIFTQPSPPTPGKIYLISSPLTGTIPGTPGDLIIYTTSNPLSGQVITVSDGTVVGGFTKTTANWTRDVFSSGSTVVLTANQTAPTTFNGICTIVCKTAGLVVTGAAGRTVLGLAGTALPIGVYTCYQDSTNILIN
jgi:hypothetical protein